MEVAKSEIQVPPNPKPRKARKVKTKNGDVEVPNPTRKARPLTAYNKFVQAEMKTAEVQALPNKDRMRVISERWKAIKNKP